MEEDLAVEERVRNGHNSHAKVLALLSHLANITQHMVFDLLIFAKVLPISFLATSAAICGPLIFSTVLAILQFHVDIGKWYLFYHIPNLFFMILVSAGLRYDGFTEVLEDPYDIFVVTFICGIFASLPYFIGVTWTSQAPRCKNFFRRFCFFFFSHAYVIFIIFLPDFATVITGNSRLTVVNAFFTTNLILSLAGLALLRAEIDNRLDHGRSVTSFLVNPRYIPWMLIVLAYLGFNVVLYVFKLQKPSILDDCRVPFLITNCVLSFFFNATLFFLIYKNWMFLDYERLPEQLTEIMELPQKGSQLFDAVTGDDLRKKLEGLEKETDKLTKNQCQCKEHQKTV